MHAGGVRIDLKSRILGLGGNNSMGDSLSSVPRNTVGTDPSIHGLTAVNKAIEHISGARLICVMRHGYYPRRHTNM